MKPVIVYIFLLFTFSMKAQHLPEFSSNAGEIEKSKSWVYKTFNAKFDAVISYERDCSLADPLNRNFLILAQKDNKWKFFIWELKLRNTSAEQKKIKKSTVKELPLNGISVDSLLTCLKQQGFWMLNNDSLGVNEKKIDDDHVERISIMDGCIEIMETFTRKNYYVLKAANVDSYQEFIFSKQRAQFINCRKQFHRLSINN